MYNTRLRKKQKIGNEWMDLMHGDKDIDPFTIAMREMLGERTINYIDFIITFRIYLDEDSINIPLEYHHANINRSRVEITYREELYEHPTSKSHIEAAFHRWAHYNITNEQSLFYPNPQMYSYNREIVPYGNHSHLRVKYKSNHFKNTFNNQFGFSRPLHWFSPRGPITNGRVINDYFRHPQPRFVIRDDDELLAKAVFNTNHGYKIVPFFYGDMDIGWSLDTYSYWRAINDLDVDDDIHNVLITPMMSPYRGDGLAVLRNDDNSIGNYNGDLLFLGAGLYNHMNNIMHVIHTANRTNRGAPIKWSQKKVEPHRSYRHDEVQYVSSKSMEHTECISS